MFGPIRRRLATVGLALTSLLPNAGKVSFMGARDLPRSMVAAVEETAAAAEPVVEKAAQAVGKGGGAVVVGVSGTVAGGAAATKGCASAARAVEETRVIPSVANDARIAATRAAESASGIGKDADEFSNLKLPRSELPPSEPGEVPPSPAERLPLANRAPVLAVPPESPLHSIARSAVDAAGLKITGAAGSVSDTVLARQLLEENSIQMTQTVLIRLQRAELLSHEQVARAFNEGFRGYPAFHATLEPSTGLIRLHLLRNGVAITAEFNAYTAAETAAAVLGTTDPLGPHHHADPGSSGL